MHRSDEVPLVRDSVRMSDAVLAMTTKHFGCVGIVNANGELIGVITDGDLRRHMDDSLLSLSVGQVMTVDPQTIRKSALVAEALALMNDRAITSLFVLEDSRPIGILHIHDCLRAGNR